MKRHIVFVFSFGFFAALIIFLFCSQGPEVDFGIMDDRFGNRIAMSSNFKGGVFYTEDGTGDRSHEPYFLQQSNGNGWIVRGLNVYEIEDGVLLLIDESGQAEKISIDASVLKKIWLDWEMLKDNNKTVMTEIGKIRYTSPH